MYDDLYIRAEAGDNEAIETLINLSLSSNEFYTKKNVA
jgi:hypothetical protein